ncbi:hypothetical protein ACWA7J_21725 [Leptothrix sp. BB-4]
MSTIKKAGAAGQAAALPAEAAAEHTKAIDAAHYVVAYQALPILRAAQNLAECRRVLEKFDQQILIDVEVHNTFQKACDAWRTAFEQDGHELVADLLRVAVEILSPIDSTLEAEAVNSRQIADAIKGSAT